MTDTYNMPSKYEHIFGDYDFSLTEPEIKAELEALLSNHLVENNTAEVKRSLVKYLDVTSLNVTDTEESILRWVEQINSRHNDNPKLLTPAALCVYPRFAKIVRESLEIGGIRVACVAGGFPSAQTYAEVKQIELSLAINDGADEIDAAIPVGEVLTGNFEVVQDQLSELRDGCGERTLKIILETGVLASPEAIRKGALMALYCGADFLKTSTGKEAVGATPAAVYILCLLLKEYHQKFGKQIGIKVAGGIKTPEAAVIYYTIVKETLGEEWLTPDLFRIGASGLDSELCLLAKS